MRTAFLVVLGLHLYGWLTSASDSIGSVAGRPEYVVDQEYLVRVARVVNEVRGALTARSSEQSPVVFEASSLASRPHPEIHPEDRKLAFLFMSRSVMPLEDVWREFFRWKANSSHYSIFTHTHMNYRFPKTSFFHGTQLPQMEDAKWGGFGLVRGMKRLVRAAMEDPRNSWFLMISESCIPLHPFSVFREKLLGFNKSIVNACDFGAASMETETRWRPGLDEVGLKKSHWRKSAQWFALLRSHAVKFANELGLERGWEKVPCSDEHYLPTTLAYYGLDNETACSDGFAHVHWNSPSDSHPHTYSAEQIGPDLFRHLNEPESVSQVGFNMQCSGVPQLCHFTARKFSGGYKYMLLENLDLILSDEHGGQYDGNPWDHHQDKLRNSNGTYFLVENGQLRELPDQETIHHMHLNASKAKKLDEIDSTAYPKGPPFPSRRDGQLLRYAKSNWIFIVKDGTRHGIPNLDTFFHINGSFEKVNVVSLADFEGIVAGEPIPDVHKLLPHGHG